MFASLRAVLHVNNSLSGRVCCFFLASRLTIVSLDITLVGELLRDTIVLRTKQEVIKRCVMHTTD